MSSRQSLILQDHNDLYNRKLKWILIPIILIPMVRLVIWQYYFAVEPVTGKTVFRSSDVGMTMSFIDKVPIHKFQVHSYFAMLSVLLMVLQKEMVSLKAQGTIILLQNIYDDCLIANSNESLHKMGRERRKSLPDNLCLFRQSDPISTILDHSPMVWKNHFDLHYCLWCNGIHLGFIEWLGPFWLSG